MPFFFFFAAGVILIFLVSGLALSGFGWIWGLKRKVPLLTWVSGLTFTGLSLVVVSGVIALGVGRWRSSQPHLVFEEAFHERPPQGTTMIHGESGSFIDSAHLSLAFRTDHATFDRLRPQALERTTADEFRASSGNESTPSWWRTPTSTTEIWINRGWQTPQTESGSHQYSSESATMTWDTDGLVQYLWSGID